MPNTNINLELFKQDCVQRDLVLFVGAGINSGCLPTWNDLLEGLIDYAVHSNLGHLDTSRRNHLLAWLKQPDGEHGLSYYEKGSLVKRMLGKHYVHVLHQKLYEKYAEPFSSTQNYLNAIADLCGSKKIHAIVTYNYDDLLETAINSKNGRRAYSIYGKKQLALKLDHLPVYHVHGYLPQDGKTLYSDDSSIVLCYEEYYQTMLETYSWQTAVQLHFLNSYTCLYLGISGRDFNMLRLLSHAQYYSKEQAKYILFCRQGLLGTNKDQSTDDLKMAVREELLSEFGLKLICAGDFYDDLHKYIGEIADNLKP